MAEEINRLYNMEDEVLLTRAQTQKNNLNTDAALFLARFPWLTAAYITSYQTDISTAEAFPLDDTVMTNISALTADVNASVIEGKGALNILFLFGEITYPKDKVKQRVFGQDKMDKARNDQEKMINLLEHANSFADKDPYKTDLLAKGYTQTEIDALLTVADNIRTKNGLQENAKSSRPVTTQERITVYNTVFERMGLVFRCAQVVFAGNPAKIEQYRVYPPKTNANTTVQLHLVATGTSTPQVGLTVKVTNISGTPAQLSDAGGIVDFNLGTSAPDALEIEVSGGAITTQNFTKDLLTGEGNAFDIEVVV
jgi:hypothetical protein